jgi:ATP-dependent Lhr-like helicase
MTKKPPHIVVTTPESLYILLTSDGGRKMLSTVRTLIVDEIHAMVDDKRGSHLSLSIERLEALVASRRSDQSIQIQFRFQSRTFRFQIRDSKSTRPRRIVGNAKADRRSGALSRRHSQHRS